MPDHVPELPDLPVGPEPAGPTSADSTAAELDDGSFAAVHGAGSDAAAHDAAEVDAIAGDDDISARVGAQVRRRKDAGALAHQIGVELTHVETDVRRILENIDQKRKRKLNGTRRWQELEDDLLSWRFTTTVSESDLTELRRLIARRHSLFGRLNFLAGTRPTWNT